MKKKIGISLVLYNEPEERLTKFLTRLESLLGNYDYKVRIFLNSTHNYKISDKYILSGDGTNLGFGYGHNNNVNWFIKNEFNNIIISNTDISFCTDLSFLFNQHENISILCPQILDTNFKQQKMIRSLPTIIDKIKSFISDYPFYKMLDNEDELIVPSFSGCFFVINVSNYLKLNNEYLFDPNIFLYEEDTDLSRRMWNTKSAKLIPKVKIIHNHEKGSKKNFNLLFLHIKSLFYYFNKWGWFDPAAKESRTYLNK